MKKLLSFLTMALLCVGMMAAPVKKTKLRVLYVGGSSDWEKGFMADSAMYANSVKERMASFEELLKSYFTTVEVMKADNYRQELSKNYDVTIMDGLPAPIAPGVENMAKGVYMRPAYLTEDFDLPMLTIGEVSPNIGTRIGCKNDWFCKCLSGDAYWWKKEHPIFNKPYAVKLNVTKKPMPEEAFMNEYYFPERLPKKVDMWTVNTKDYKNTEGFAIGMVARPWGYEDCSDGEIISGGVSSKSPDAVAIGRHGNFLHWGFAASPLYMSEEAKVVFVNAVAYIAQFKGKGMIVRKYNETISTRERLLDLAHMASEKAYEESVEVTKTAQAAIDKIAAKARAKKEKGETLTPEEEAYLNMPPMPIRSREETMKMMLGSYYDRFGMDEAAYVDYFNTIRPYAYPNPNDPRGLSFIEDEDVKSLGIPNNDIRLLDAAIRLLEEGKEEAKARRILARYTLLDFSRASEWRYWFNKNRDKLFFSEAGGWVFLIDSHEPGVNPYKAASERKKLQALSTPETSDKSPVSVSATHAILSNGEEMVYVKIKIHSGYHIYAYTSSDSPFIPTTVEITLPEGYEKMEAMQVPAGRFYTQSGTTIYDGEIVYAQKVRGKGAGDFKCKVAYQCCDNYVCFPPTETEVTFK